MDERKGPNCILAMNAIIRYMLLRRKALVGTCEDATRVL